MRSHLHLACGRDGGFGACIAACTVLTGPPKGQRAGRSAAHGRYGIVKFFVEVHYYEKFAETVCSVSSDGCFSD